MIKIKEELLREVLRAANISDDTLRIDYSGRGMYGKTCFGFVGDIRDLCRFFVAFVSDAASSSTDIDNLCERVELADDLAEAVRWDNMGYDKIFYFPGFGVLLTL